ncbi:MAG TPA: hypothetical protein VF097_00545 [Actinomycetota bacterium]
MNLVPRRYRSVSLAEVGSLDPVALRDHFVGREAYRRTEFIVARAGDGLSLLRVEKASVDPLFSPITSVQVLASPDECAVVEDPEVDTAIPTQLGRAALDRAPGARCVVVTGRYEHVSFILDPAPIPVRVVEVTPPHPAKLVDQVRRVLDTAEDLPPVDLRPEEIDIVELARTRPSDRYLYPCRGSGVAPEGAEVAYLDQHPPKEDWVLVGCERSAQIHRWFYDEDAPYVEMCPRELTRASEVPTLTKCCMLEFGVERDGGVVVVPWGASLEEIREGLRIVMEVAEPAWEPV